MFINIVIKITQNLNTQLVLKDNDLLTFTYTVIQHE